MANPRSFNMPTAEEVKDLKSVYKNYLSYTDEATRQSDLKTYLEDKGLVNRIFTNAVPTRKLIRTIRKMCEDVAEYEQDAIAKEAQFTYVGGQWLLINHAGLSLFNDKGKLHSWVADALEKPWANHVEQLLKDLFTMSSLLVIDENNEIRIWIREFIGGDRFAELIKTIDIETLRWLLLDGIITFNCMVMSREVQQLHQLKRNSNFVKVVGALSSFINHQKKVIHEFVTEYSSFAQSILMNEDFKQSRELEQFYQYAKKQYKILLKDPCRDHAKFNPLLKRINEVNALPSNTEPYNLAFANLIMEIRKFSLIKPLVDCVEKLDSKKPYYLAANSYLASQVKAVNELEQRQYHRLRNSMYQFIFLLDALRRLEDAISAGKAARGNNDVYITTSRLIYAGVCDDAKSLFTTPARDPTHKEKVLLTKVLSATATGARDPSNPRFVTEINELFDDPDLPGQPEKGAKWKGGLLMLLGFVTLGAGFALSISCFGAASPLCATLFVCGGGLVSAGLWLAGVTIYNRGKISGIAKNIGKFHDEITKNRQERQAQDVRPLAEQLSLDRH